MELNELLSKESSLKSYQIENVLKVEYLKKSKVFRVYLKSEKLLDPKIKEPVAGFLARLMNMNMEVSIINILDGLSNENVQDVLLGMFLNETLS